MAITKKWVVNRFGEGHWEIFVNGKAVTACDDGELTETIHELYESLDKQSAA